MKPIGFLGKSKSSKVTPWYEYHLESGELLDPEIVSNGLVKQAIHTGKHFNTIWVEGYPTCTSEELYETIFHLDPTFKYLGKLYNPKTMKMGKGIVYNEQTFIYVASWDNESSASIKISSTDSFANFERIVSEIKKLCVTKQRQGTIKSIYKTKNALRLQDIGTVISPIERSNYTPDVLEKFDLVVKDLNSDCPNGRLAIFDGPPGTGKTYLLRALLIECPTCQFVIVPSKLVNELGDPEMIPLLSSAKEENEQGGPIVLLLEDADAILSSRMADNMDKIMTALNIGDGLFGEIFNLRIIATTNIALTSIDPAMLRPGRLSSRVEVKMLPLEFAQTIYKRLLGNEATFPLTAPEVSLAEVYGIARSNGWQPEPTQEKIKVGGKKKRSWEMPDYDF